MPADHIAYRVKKYESMGFSHIEACTLSHTLTDEGLPLYWDDVRKLLEQTEQNHAVVLDIVLDLPMVSIEYGDDDDGA